MRVWPPTNRNPAPNLVQDWKTARDEYYAKPPIVHDPAETPLLSRTERPLRRT